MKISRLAASLLALGLFAGPLAAQPPAVEQVLAQAEILPPAVQNLLSDARPVSALSVGELQKRIRQSTQLSQLPLLPPQAVTDLRSRAAAAKAELERRKSAQGSSDSAGANGGDSTAQAGASEPDQAPAEPAQAQSEPGAGQGQATTGFDQGLVSSFLADQQPASALGAKGLGRRIKSAQAILALPDLPPKIRTSVKQRMMADQAQLQKLTAANTQQQANTNDQQGGGNGQQGGSGQQGGDGKPGGNLLLKVTQYLNETRNPAAMNTQALKAAIADGDAILARPNLPPPVKLQVSAVQTDLRSELKVKTAASNAGGGNQQGTGQAGNGQQGGNQQGNTQGNQQGGNPAMAAARRYFQDTVDPKKMTLDKLVASIALGERLRASADVPADMKTKINSTQQAMRSELELRKSASNGQPGDNGQPVGAISQVDENQARQILADNRDAQTMNLPDLRQRVNAIRTLLQRKQLSAPTRNKLLAKLDIERFILRDRMAQAQAQNGTGQTSQPGQPGGQTQPDQPGQPGQPITNDDVQWVRNDHRQPRDLKDDELRFRINIVVNILSNNMYPADRYDWQRRLDMDRQVLRERMLEERARREAELRRQREKILLDQQRAQYDDLAAAEASDRELQDTLAAAPRRTFDRRYSINDLENNADLRAALPRIEIDTIHFGFNEAFVREEEVNNLDRVAQVMERILASNPNEVFLIEGHTDASGSDSYNLGLSRQRAQAVMQALTTYYVIPARNLRTVGYGERYLKIPVDGPEAENRRVSVSRITDVVGMD